MSGLGEAGVEGVDFFNADIVDGEDRIVGGEAGPSAEVSFGEPASIRQIDDMLQFPVAQANAVNRLFWIPIGIGEIDAFPIMRPRRIPRLRVRHQVFPFLLREVIEHDLTKIDGHGQQITAVG